jgi:hypothetical protein
LDGALLVLKEELSRVEDRPKDIFIDGSIRALAELAKESAQLRSFRLAAEGEGVHLR